MTAPVGRAGVFAALCTLSLVVPLFGPQVGAAVAGVVLLGAYLVPEGSLFDLLAYPGDYEDARLYGLITFVLAGVALGLIATAASMSIAVFVGTILLVGYGNLGEQLVRLRTGSDVVRVAGFCLAGSAAAVAGLVGTRILAGDPVTPVLPVVVFLAASGVFLAALLRDMLLRSDDPIVVLSVGLLLWLLAELGPTVGGLEIGVALAVTIALGYASYALETASIAGMLTGVLLVLLTIVLGGYPWVAVLVSFFAIGGLSTKFRYARKAELGVAEDNNGARGSGNVLGNAAVALVAVLGYAASDAGLLPHEPELFLFAFAGSVATAMSDTLSSEIGSVFDRPRLITTLEPVDPGTDGGVTWQGELAGIVGATIVAAIAAGVFPEIDLVGGAVIVAAGIVGMTVDSLLGATLEGPLLGNQSVNFLATLSGALASAALVMAVPLLG